MFALVATVSAIILTALIGAWWAYIRLTKVVFPAELTEKVETEDFRKWLSEQSTWLIWGREMDGRYYAITSGSISARAFRQRAVDQAER